MESETSLRTYQKGIDENVINKLNQIKTAVVGADRRLETMVKDMEKKSIEYPTGKLKAHSDHFKHAKSKLVSNIDEAIIHMRNDFTILSKNLTESTIQKEIADKIRIRIDSFKEPKTPKYLSGIGTAFIPSSGGIFATIFFFTSNIALASLFLTVLLSCGLICFIYSIILIKKYDDELNELHKSYNIEVKKLQALTRARKKITKNSDVS